jgi:hypothetical protein
MPQSDHGIKELVDTSGRQLARLAGLNCQQWRPVESTLPATTELLADRVFQVREGRERFAVYFEFYTRWDRHAPWDMLAKSGLVSKRLHLPTVCVPVVFHPRGFRSLNGTFRLEAVGGPTQQLWIREVCLWNLKPEPWWEDEPGLMALYPLCQHGRQPREAITFAAEAIERKVPTPGARDEALALLTIFGERAFPRLDVERLIGSEKMKESRVLRRMRQEGALATLRASLIKVVRAHFGEPFAAEVADTINSMEDLARLEQLFDATVLEGISADGFRMRLSAVEANN